MGESIARVEAAFLFRPAVCPLVITRNVDQRALQAVEPTQASLVAVIAARTPENIPDVNGERKIVSVHVLEHEGITPVFPRVIRRISERAKYKGTWRIRRRRRRPARR